MTDTELLIAALRQCADRFEACMIHGGTEDTVADDAVREYRLLADLCEGKLWIAVANEGKGESDESL